MKLLDKVDSEFHRVLVFGGPKSGKTQLCAQLAQHFNILLFDLENGYKVFRKLPVEWQERVDIISIPDTKDYPIAAETMLKVILGTKTEICDKHGKVACPICKKDGGTFTVVELNGLDNTWVVVVDSLTQLANSFMNHITKDQDVLYKPEWTDFRNQGSLMDKFLSRVQQAQFNICCITHEVESELEDGRKKLVPVAGTREFSRNTAKYFDHVVYCEVKNKGHKFGSATDYGTGILTGSRTDVKLESMEAVSLMAIFRPDSASSKPKTSMATAATTPTTTSVNSLKSRLAGFKGE